MSSNIHMICGLTGVRFSIDDWNARLFFMDRDPTSDFQWFYDRVQRSCAQIRDTAEQVLQAGVPVIFDCGFTNAQERRIFYDWAADLGQPVTLHYLDVDRATRWQRVQQRNAERGATFALEVTPEMFDFMQTLWQAPESGELPPDAGQMLTV